MPDEAAAPAQKTRHFPCVKCGADVEFVPRVGMKCPFCGHQAGLPQNEDQVIEESDFEAHFRRPKKGGYGVREAREVKCAQCAASTRVSGDAGSIRCAFCGAPIVVEESSDEDVIRPEAALPFRITKQEALDRFNAWVSGLWFAPNELRRLKEGDRIAGVYRPYWTFDSHTFSAYRGERGEYYYVTVPYTTTENGKTVTRTRQERRTRWYPASGHVDRFFDDVLVFGGRAAGWPTTYNLGELCPYDPGFLAGWQAERYALAPEQAWPQAKFQIDEAIRGLVREDIGGDEQRIHELRTAYDALKFKHLLLPLFLASYFYNAKTYHFQVNGQSGEVKGERPYSFWKIFLLVVGILAALGLIAGIYALTKS